jgi:hypothetical protein
MATNLGRINPTRVIIVFAALVALVLAGGFVWKHWFEPRPLPQISSVTYHQYQAVLDFDDAEYTQDDATQLAKLQQLLEQYDVTPGVTQTAPQDGCTGGLSTTAIVSYRDTSTAKMFISSCDSGNVFAGKANDLFSEWRKAAGGK